MTNEKIKLIMVRTIKATMIGLGIWYVYNLQTTLDLSMEVLQEAYEISTIQQEVINDAQLLIELQRSKIDEYVEVIDFLHGEIDGLEAQSLEYREQVIQSTAEVERVTAENASLKKSIADLHARNAQRTSANGSSITENDRILLAQLVYSEARGEGIQGQRAVVDVVLNRLNDSRFPNSIREIIMAPRQFDEAHILHTYPATDVIKASVDAAIQGNDVTNGALFFFNPNTAGCGWQWSRTQTAQIGKHRFSR